MAAESSKAAVVLAIPFVVGWRLGNAKRRWARIRENILLDGGREVQVCSLTWGMRTHGGRVVSVRSAASRSRRCADSSDGKA